MIRAFFLAAFFLALGAQAIAQVAPTPVPTAIPGITVNSVFIGNGAGPSPSATAQTGYNVDIGQYAGVKQTSGVENDLIGAGAGEGITTGFNNDCLGFACLVNQTTGSENACLGAFCLAGPNAATVTGGQNSALGYAAGQNITTGGQNTLIGWTAGQTITTGVYDECLGSGCLNYQTLANQNVCIGAYCLEGSSSGTNTGGLNSAVGHSAGANLTSGAQNALFGIDAGLGLTTGYGNTLLGSDADLAAANSITTGAENIAIGNNVEVNSPTANGQLTIANAIFGLNNIAQDGSVSTGCIGIYNRNCTYTLDVTGAIHASGYIAAGPYVPSAGPGNVSASSSTTCGALLLGGTSSNGSLDYGCTTAGVFHLNAALSISGTLFTTGALCPNSAGPCYYAGVGAPTFSAANGSEYLRYDGTTGSRVYYNTSGASTSGTTWTALASP